MPALQAAYIQYTWSLKLHIIVQNRGSPMQVKTEKPDADMKDLSPLCALGRDEKYIANKLGLWGLRASYWMALGME